MDHLLGTSELIALSLEAVDYIGLAGTFLLERGIPDLPCESGKYKFYFVMWIEWENGIAYRKAIGTVFKNVWESQELEDVDITLG